jgi:hypothetical protein
MRAEAASQLTHVLDGSFAALAHDVGGAELFARRDTVGVATEEDDVFGTEAAMTPHSPTAPSPTTAAVLPGPTLAETRQARLAPFFQPAAAWRWWRIHSTPRPGASGVAATRPLWRSERRM